MANVTIKQILLAEPSIQRACFVSFSDGTNVLTSTGNGRGKTSLSKFILRSLGSDPSMSDKWADHLEKIFSQIDFTLDQNRYSIMRFSHFYRIYKGGVLLGKFSTQKDYQELLPVLFGFPIKIKDKNSNSFLSATPSLYLLPNYLPQVHPDDPFRSIFMDLKRFELNSIIDSLYFQTGALDEKYSATLAELTKNKMICSSGEASLSSLKQEQAFIGKKLDSLKSVFSPMATVKSNSDIVSKMANYDDEIYRLQQKIFDKKHELSMLSKSQECNNDVLSKMDDKNSIICPNCGYELNSLFRDILSIKLSNETIATQLSFVKAELLNLEDQLKKKQAKALSLKPSYDAVLAARSNSITGDELVYWSAEYNRVNLAIQKESQEFECAQKAVDEANGILASYQQKKELVLKKYRSLYNDILLSSGVSSQNMPSFDSLRLSERVFLEGSEISRSDIASFFAFAECKEGGFVHMPLLLDFPNNDLNRQNLIVSFGVMMKELEKNLSHQVLIFSIDAEERAASSGHSFSSKDNIISFEKRDELLTESDYSTYINQINDLVTNF
jgi:hypothetical protein